MHVDMDIVIEVDGEQYLTTEVEAKCELDNQIDGEPKVLETIHDGVYYRGPVTVTPSSEQQVLETSQLMLAENITIEPIPSNYGLITWDGHKLTIS